MHLDFAIDQNWLSFQNVLHDCHQFSYWRGYDFRVFEDVYRQCTSQNLDNMIAYGKWRRDDGYIQTRNMGCRKLGRSINEVLRTYLQL